MVDLLADYNLVEGDRIEVQVTASNIYGTSDLSEIVDSSIKYVQTVPHKPAQSPERGALTSQNQVKVVINAFTSLETGGSAVLSYVISWDAGLGGTYSDLSGDLVNSLLTEEIYTGLTSGVYYSFKYRARNVHGDGPDSDPITIVAATVPT